ncbi:MAG: DUF4835 domain-containing protein [Flavobacteriaceae bacterium]|nr:DUF4835 domain-containing protein [Flavobacteriaceae bacterium]|tara:strand:+ start:6029 stop:6910 length:882 start_codon:yes stop_codon:yes gene_type:complete
MNKLLFFIICSFASYAQELRCEVIINSDLVNQTNQQIFSTLQQSIQEFMNSQVWTSQNWNSEEKINCSLILNLTDYNDDKFKGTLQVQSQRTVYDTNYSSPILNFQDLDISFNYQEFQPLFYNSNVYESNLISILSFYAYIIIGLDADTFKLKGGELFFSFAQKISNLAQQSNNSGWLSSGNRKNRYWLVDSILSNAFLDFRITYYKYHRNGLDLMTKDQIKAKTNLAGSLIHLSDLNNRRPNSFLIQMFFDAKSQEIVNVFSEGPTVDIISTRNILKNIAPFFNNKWKEIKS